MWSMQQSLRMRLVRWNGMVEYRAGGERGEGRTFEVDVVLVRYTENVVSLVSLDRLE